MAIKQVFESEYGETFGTEEEAKAHDELCAAKQGLEDAQARMTRAYAGVNRTADGEMFVFGKYHRYYYFAWDYAIPSVREVTFNYRSSLHDDNEWITIDPTQPIPKSVQISGLYVDRRKCEIACICERDRVLALEQKETDDMKTRLGLL